MLTTLVSCQTFAQKPLYQSDAFTVFPDRVVQGTNEAKVISPTEILSTYKSPASQHFSRLVKFKVSINEKDNELPAGIDHWLVIGDEHESPIIKFGEQPQPISKGNIGFLPVNYQYTFKIDLSSVIKQFDEKGYFEAFDGSKVAKADFKGFYLAGGSEPLSWDFVNLSNKGLQLQDPDKDNIYTLTVTFNPFDEKANLAKTWKLEKDLSKKPHYQSNQPIVDALFNLSLEEALKNIEADSTFRTGAKWGGVWTRDISYSILLAFAYHEPEVAKISLLKKVKRDRIIQDTGSGGAWPVSSDRTTWSLAAWEIYKATGDKVWLKKAYKIIKNSLEDDYKIIKSADNLYSGESSFLDWREQTYPKWMSNMDIYVSENLGTNVVHYQAHKILAEMASILGEPSGVYQQRAESIKKAINQQLWMADKGYYGQYLYGRYALNLSPRFEALGEALAILFDVADAQKAQAIISKSPITQFGVTCIYPQIPNIPPYHNNGIWPFVQSYWNMAAAKTGNEKVLEQGLASVYRAAALFLTNYENFVAETGDFWGTEINSDRMLWSMAGNLAMVHRVFMGINFEANGIRFSPAIPTVYGGTKKLSNFKYRKAILEIEVQGTGNKIVSFKLDGKLQKTPFVPANLTGKYKIEIVMANNAFDTAAINHVANVFSPANPQATLNNNTLSWTTIEGASAYKIYKNGSVIKTQTATSFEVSPSDFAEYKVSAVSASGVESFTSEPVLQAKSIQKIEIENHAKVANLPYTNFSGNGFVEISTNENKVITFEVNIETAGEYLLDFRYSNGNGPWNTDNKCAIRSLYADNQHIGAYVFPQRGKGEWSDWGYSNARKIQLSKGKHSFKLSFEDWNNNMNVAENKAMLDFVRLIKTK